MQGLDLYIAKHGRHFTKELAIDAIEARWSSEEIEKHSNTLVYYNVSSATLGDIVYLTNLYYHVFKILHPTKRNCIRYALGIIGNVNAEGYAFNHWLCNGENVDLNPYI